jgi:hypothetical protein
MTTKIEAVLFSYKNKNLKLVVDTLLSKTTNEIFINVFDQNTIDRAALFKDSRVKYSHIVWDKIDSPSEKKGDCINSSKADYILELSDDCFVLDDWDTKAINFIENNNAVLSGNSFVKILKDNPFFFSKAERSSDKFEITNYVSRNFIFATNKAWSSIQYPYHLKFNGEEDLISLDFFRMGYDIYCANPTIYTKTDLDTIDKLYVPFSKNHNYNTVVDRVNHVVKEKSTNSPRSDYDFFVFHGLSGVKLAPLPYDTNDVSYDPYGLSFQDVDARKFISKTNSIY